MGEQAIAARAGTGGLERFVGREAGNCVVVCGCGRSLHELADPGRFTTIGVNDVGRLFDPTYLVVVNPRSQFQGDRFRHVENSNAQALFTQLDLGRVRPPVVRFQLGKYAGTDDGGPNSLHYTQNSPYVAVCLAVRMGARRIGLIGVDLTDDHFFARTGRHPLSGRLHQIDREYGALAQACRERGVEIVNLGSTSRLASLPRMSVAEFGSAATRSRPAEAAAPAPRRVFVVNYRFLSCGEVFTDGLRHAAAQLGYAHADAYWDDPQLPQKVARFRPDVVLVVHGRRFAQKWGDKLRAHRTAVWLVDEPYEVDDTAQWSGRFDTVFLNDASTLDRHANAHVLPVCFDPAVYRDAGLERTYPAGFIGGSNPARERFLAKLAEEGLLGYVVGGPWRSPGLGRLCLAPNIPAYQSAELYQRTAIVVNVFRDRHHFNQRAVPARAMNPRVYEALACGALVVSEPRPELSEVFPELPTFSTPESLVATVRELAADRVRLAGLLEASRARLGGHDYAARLKRAMDIAMQSNRRPSMMQSVLRNPAAATATAVIQAPPAPPELPGWAVIGNGCTAAADGTIAIVSLDGGETGLASLQPMRSACLRATVRISGACQFIAKMRHAESGRRDANSYHLVSTGATIARNYVARHHHVLMPVQLPRGRWFRLEMHCEGPLVRVCVDGREAGRCIDGDLAEGYAFIGTCGGMLELRDLSVDALADPDPRALLQGWMVKGAGVSAAGASSLTLAASDREETSITSEAALNDVELEFEVCLDAHACFVAKIHQQDAQDANSNSYHLFASPAQGFVARHDHVLGQVRLARRRWQRVVLRWVDQQLTASLDGRVVLNVGDNLLQSGHCALGVSAGCAEVRGLAIRDATGTGVDRRPVVVPISAVAAPRVESIPYAGTPRRHLMYHVWPVRDSMWRWNVERLLADIDLFNGRRIVGIVHDGQSEPPEAVRAAFEGHGCEFIEVPNDARGECLTFPAMLQCVASLDPDDVTFYGHAKGVKHGRNVSGSIRRWTEALYDASLGQWPLVADHLRRHALTGSFRMLGRFRAHQYLGDWHYSGTFFWIRNALAFRRAIHAVPQFYGGVEVWPGLHFRREETGCLLLDNLRELPYNDAFWRSTGNAAVARLKAACAGVAPPADLQHPVPFEGRPWPRLEQIPGEFEWFLDRLVAAAPRTILTIGSMHGGVEWHVARRFRERNLDVHITAVDLGGRPELMQALGDARERWSQRVDAVIGDSTAASTRVQLAPRYDAVFIDGDHGYRGARLDYEFALTREPRLVALHDIVDSMWHAHARCCVSRLWSEIEAGGNGEARRLGEWGGIGIVAPRH
jgi:hypothetical protein